MKKIFLLTLLLACTMGAAKAQTKHSKNFYGKQWAAVDAARRDDLPRTAIGLVDGILRQAVKEGYDAQILSALITRHTLLGDISTDSLPAAKQRIEAALKEETRPEMQALWHSALGILYGREAWRDTLMQRKSREHFAASLGNIEALGRAKAIDYVPALAYEPDSKIFGGDLLHVLTRAAQEVQPSFLPAHPILPA